MRKRFGTLVWYDLNYGYRDCRLKWLCALLVQIYFANMAYQACSSAEGAVGVTGYLTWLFRGMPEYFVVETGRFELPVPWLILHACLLFLVGFYPVHDLTRSGGQAFVRSGRRRDWLLAKAFWVVSTVAAYYVCLAAILTLTALATGGLDGSAEAMRQLYGLSIEEMREIDIFLFWWAEPFLVSAALCMTEMVLSLLVDPALALFLMLGCLTASVFWTTPVLPGNYAMLMRQEFWSGNREISILHCIAVCVAYSVAALVVGSRYIRKKDIFLSEI